MKKVIALSAIIRDPVLQQRARLDQDAIDEMAELYQGGECEIPAPHVFGEKGAKEYWLADGFHRINAAAKAELKGLEVEIHEGDYEDAKLFSCGANKGHGVRPSPADKRKAVRTLLNSKRWNGKTGRWIAGIVGVSHTLVDQMRAESPTGNVASSDADDTRVGRNGKRYKVKPRKKKGSDGEADSEPEAGEEIFDHKAFYAAFNSLLRFTNRMYQMHKLTNSNGTTKRDEDFETIIRHLDSFLAAFSKRWGYLAGGPFPKQ